MPDTITPEITPPKVQAVDVLAGGEAPVFKGKKNEFRQALEDAHKRRQAGEAEAVDDPKAFHLKATEVPEYTAEDLNKTTTALGANNALKEAIEPLVQYLAGVKKSLRTGDDLNKALDTEADEIKKKVGEILVKRGGLSRKFEGLDTAFSTPDELHKYIEQNIMRDPDFQKALVDTLTHIQTEAAQIKTPDSDEKTRLIQQRDAIDTSRKAVFEKIQSTLGDRGLKEPQRQQVMNLIESGTDIQTIIETLKIDLKIDDTFSEYGDAEKSLKMHEAEEISARARLNNARDRNTNRNGSIRADTPVIAQLSGELQQATSRKEAAERTRSAIKNAYNLRNNITDDTGFERARQANNANAALLVENGPLSQILEIALRNQVKLAEINAQIKQIDENPENETANKRKQELIRELEGAVDTAIATFLEKRYTKAETNVGLQLEAARKKAEKEGKSIKANYIKIIQDEINGIRKYDAKKKKFVIDRANVGKNLSRIAELSADGSDGVKKLFAEKLGYELDPEKLKDLIAGEKKDLTTGKKVEKPTKYDELTPEQKLEADMRMQQRTADFESIYAEHGKAFKKTLFESYAASKGFLDRFSWGTMNLSDDEIKILNSQFGDVMDSALEKSSLYKDLKEKGMAHGKLKIILAILAILGITAATVGIAPAAVAVGTAAKGLGSAAWS